MGILGIPLGHAHWARMRRRVRQGGFDLVNLSLVRHLLGRDHLGHATLAVDLGRIENHGSTPPRAPQNPVVMANPCNLDLRLILLGLVQRCRLVVNLTDTGRCLQAVRPNQLALSGKHCRIFAPELPCANITLIARRGEQLHRRRAIAGAAFLLARQRQLFRCAPLRDVLSRRTSVLDVKRRASPIETSTSQRG